ncbi:MAG: rhomboid family intramembrane serine protease [Candidatus Thermoplasmatota archaeon]|nr:rhomboid family intramembrane serine protease [Candidatus Thermoplasmatota archaeon]
MTTLVGGEHSLILLVMIAIGFILSIVLPWLKKASATNVISGTIIVVFAAQFVLTGDLFGGIPLLGELGSGSRSLLFQDLAFSPRRIIDDLFIHQFLTSTFLHSGFIHVMFNFLGLFILGTQLEQRIGWQRLLVIYYGSGIVAGAVVLVISPFDILGHTMNTVSLGASGCIFGLLGGFWYLYPREEIFFPLILIRKWPVSLIVLVYGGISALFILLGSDDNVSHIAHFAGLIGAFPIAFLVRKREGKEDEGKEDRKSTREELMVLADTRKKKEILEKALSADEDDVRDAWFEDLFKRVNCPKCKGKGMNYDGKEARCPRCGHRIRT